MRAGIIGDRFMRWLPALLALGATALVGCGGGPPYVHDEDGVLRVTLDEYRLRPENVVVPGGRIHLVAVNRGRLTHNLAIEEWDPKRGGEPKLYGRTDTLQPGVRGREQHPITLRPGTYRILCTLSGHDDLGQYGELKVVAR
jgi:hypothetical protein